MTKAYDVFNLARAILKGELKRVFWTRNPDRTATIYVYVYQADGKAEGSRLVESARRESSRIAGKMSGDVVGAFRRRESQSYLGADESNRLRAVSVTTVPITERSKKVLDGMGIVEVC